MRKVTFGVTDRIVVVAIGSIGLSPSTFYGFNESDISDKVRESVLNSMARQGLINSRTFSLALGSYDSPIGNIHSLVYYDLDLLRPVWEAGNRR